MSTLKSKVKNQYEQEKDKKQEKILEMVTSENKKSKKSHVHGSFNIDKFLKDHYCHPVEEFMLKSDSQEDYFKSVD